jgi:RimJ/RimL family protein N-acetyltransferase
MFYFETGRLVVKPHTLANLELFNRWENDPELLYYNDEPPHIPQSLDDTRRYLERISDVDEEGRIIHFAIHLAADDRFIGYGMVALIDHTNCRCQLGITIGEPPDWGHGYAREALEAVIGYCFTQLGMHRVSAGVYAFNPRSIGLFERLGFTREGVARESVLKRGRFADEYHYSLLRQEWEARRG